MNITVIYDNSSQTCVYNCVQLLLNNLKLNISINVTEYFLSTDYLCNGHFSCPKSDLETCDISYIIKSLDDSDLFILASSVFTCDISTEMKILLDKLSYYCLSNNTSWLMHNKIGLSISTSAGAGLFYVAKILQKKFNFLGINHTFKFSKTLYEENWNDVNLKMKMKINKKILKLSYKIVDIYTHTYTAKLSTFKGIAFSTKEPAAENNDYNVINLNNWRNQHSLHNRNIQ